MLKVGVVGLGKMGLSHLSMLRAHPDVDLVAVVDSTGYILDVLSKYTGLKTYTDYTTMLRTSDLDAVLIATPTKLHAEMVRQALDAGLHVFCEKPLCLTSIESQELAERAQQAGLVSQVGYHNRFVGAFREVKRVLEAGAVGRVTHVLAESYGPVVLREKGSTWRSHKAEGGGCLYDYAAHPIDLMTWYLGQPLGAAGAVLNRVFSAETEDEVYGTLHFADGASGQVSVNWSDESVRKMTTKITIWGTHGRIISDRQECQVYLRDGATLPTGYTAGWNVKYTTELTDPVWFYLRGEEYSAQLDHFVKCALERNTDGVNTFASAAITDRALEMLASDAETVPGSFAGGRPSAHRSDAPAQSSGKLAKALARSVGRGLVAADLPGRAKRATQRALGKQAAISGEVR